MVLIERLFPGEQEYRGIVIKVC